MKAQKINSKKIIKKKTSKKLKPSKKKVKKNKIKLKKIFKSKEPQKENFILKIINFQNSLKPEINFNINFSFEKYIQAFFDKIATTISQYKILKKDEERRLKLEKQERERQKKIEIAKERQKEQELKVKLKEQALKDEVKICLLYTSDAADE